MKRILKNSLNLSHDFLKKVVEKGDCVIDATCGAGNDTLFLANLVGESGEVISFDIQKCAIDIASKKIQDNLKEHIVRFVNDGHENLDLYVNKPVSAVVFNLGYLPKGNHSIATKHETTIIAIKKALNVLKKNGLVVVVIYSGGDSGFTEKENVLKYVSTLSQKEYNVMKVDFINQANNPPILVVIEKI